MNNDSTFGRIKASSTTLTLFVIPLIGCRGPKNMHKNKNKTKSRTTLIFTTINCKLNAFNLRTWTEVYSFETPNNNKMFMSITIGFLYDFIRILLGGEYF